MERGMEQSPRRREARNERWDAQERLAAMLSEHGLDRDFCARKGEEREALISRLADSFRLAQEKSKGAFFDVLERAPGEVSDWFYATSWRGAALLRAGFSPMRYGSLRDQSGCYSRSYRVSPEYREITLTALAQGWKPDTADMAGGSSFDYHPISKAIWIWVAKEQPERTCLDVIEALVAASPMYGPEWVERATLCSFAPDHERERVALHVRGLLMARDQKAQLEKAAPEAFARPSGRSASL